MSLLGTLICSEYNTLAHLILACYSHYTGYSILPYPSRLRHMILLHKENVDKGKK